MNRDLIDRDLAEMHYEKTFHHRGRRAYLAKLPDDGA